MISKSTSQVQQWQQFEESEAVHRRQSYKRAAILATVFIIAAASLDWVVFRDLFGTFFVGRMITGALLLLVLFGLTVTRNRTLFRIMGHCVALLPMLVIDWMIYHTGGGSSPYYGGLCTVLVGAALILRWPTTDSIINALICVGGYLYISLILVPNHQPGDVFTHTYFMFVTAVFACVGTYFYNDIRYREFLLVQEVEAAREKVENTNQQLRAIDETKSRFFANLSHELRTPLTLILGPTENLRGLLKSSNDPVCDEYLDTIEENGYRLLRLINDILDLVKLDSGESPPRPESVDVNSFVESMVSNLKPIASMKNVAISSQCDVLQMPVVWLDRDRLEKIILNLSVNAVKFTSSGGSIILAAEIKDNKLQFTVTDTGQGMSQEEVDNVFVRFWQADMSAKRKHRGAGIGLSLVKSLTESMDGEVKVTSELGEGSAFSIELPAIEPPTGASEDEGVNNKEDVLERFNSQARTRTDLASTQQSLLADKPQSEDFPGKPIDRNSSDKRKRVLVADDEEAMRHFITRQLGEYELVEARDGDEAWALSQKYKPDLVILDLMMPGLDGIEVTRKLRAHEQLSRVPVILITAQASEAPRLEALEAGVNDFISKPFSTVELSVRAKNLLNSAEFEIQLSDNNERLELAYGQLKEQESLLVHTEKLSSLGRMSAGIVHEVNNPLNYTKTALHALETFKGVLPEDERDDYLDVLGDAREGVQRVIGIVSDLRSFTRGDETHMDELVLKDVVESARRLCSSGLSGMKFSADINEKIIIQGNEGQLCQVMVNFFQNSIQAIELNADNIENGEVKVSAEQQDDGSLIVRVRDNGCGIPLDVQNKIFDPFFTQNDVGDGMGLGLSICHRIIKQHHATVSVESEVGKFTEFTMIFSTND